MTEFKYSFHPTIIALSSISRLEREKRTSEFGSYIKKKLLERT
jgi:hypothetical protein